jgi:hypothetical protein
MCLLGPASAASPLRRPRTEISRACDVSHNVSGLFERRRFVYGFRNRTFAEAFEHANTSQVWSARDQARMRKWSGIAALLFRGGHIGARPLLWYFEGR